jgi:hypothetical protein
MLSAGLLGGPGIGYEQDKFASEYLKSISPQGYQRYEAEKENSFLFFPKVRGLDGAKVGVVRDAKEPGAELAETVARLKEKNIKNEEVEKLNTWWQTEAKAHAAADKPAVAESVLEGGRMALIYTAAVPAFMALCYLLLVIYFRAKGGYKQEHLAGFPDVVEPFHGEEFTGGVPAPVR